MPENGRRHDHFGVITALENFQVRAAGERRFDADAHLAGLEHCRGDFLDAHVFFAVKNSGFHGGWNLVN